MRLHSADILKLVPEFMRSDEAVKGLAAAVNALIREPGSMVKTARVWDQIDNLNDQQLDELAYELDIDWYSSSLPLENKRAVVKISDLVHSRRGTKWAVEELISAYIAPGEVLEWYQDGYEYLSQPKPFHFSITTKNRHVTNEVFREFNAIAKVAMSIRSRIDCIYFSDVYGVATVAERPAIEAFFFTPKKCGTIPRIATIGQIDTEHATAAETSEAFSFTSPEAGSTTTGTYPREAMLGTLSVIEATVGAADVSNSFGTIKCGTAKCGS